MPVEPFRIAITDDVLDDLHARLARTRWKPIVPDAGWDYGIDPDYLRDLLSHWQTGFDWRHQEAALNAYPHFRASIEGMGIHFIHVRSEADDAMPIILTHGWPDSFVRMLDLIPRLTEPETGPSFHVVVPSIPGFAFSDPPNRRGFTPVDIANHWHHLMHELGYTRYVAHGGDLGSGITQRLAQLWPNDLAGIHLTDVPYLNTMLNPPEPDSLTDAEREFLAQGVRWRQEEGAYSMLQSTKPQTLATALNDSPAGLAAWIAEKVHRWAAEPDRIDRDRLLTNITIYWVTQSIGSSFLPYYEPMHSSLPDSLRERVTVPSGFAIFPEDLVREPRDWAERFFNVTQWTEMPRGGHFAAMEEPDLLSTDIRHFADSLDW